MGNPPCSTKVPFPVGVKNAGIPAPPALSFSANVPCGTSSTSSSPLRYYLSNSLFSPTYDAIIRLTCLLRRRMPKPKSSMPQLFETIVRSLGPCYAIAVIRFSGMPHRPNPPAHIVAPSLISLVASAAESNILVAKYLAEGVYC